MGFGAISWTEAKLRFAFMVINEMRTYFMSSSEQLSHFICRIGGGSIGRRSVFPAVRITGTFQRILPPTYLVRSPHSSWPFGAADE